MTQPVPDGGDKTVTLTTEVNLNGVPFVTQATTLYGLTDGEERSVMDALNTAVRPFKASAEKAKA